MLNLKKIQLLFMITQLLLQLVCCFDYFVMALQWPAGVCSNGNPRGQRCIRVIPNSFTVHGYWPKNNDPPNLPLVQVSNPLSDESQLTADLNMIPNLYNEMNMYWPQLFFSGTNLKFWFHEYNRHGIYFPGTPDQYFNKALYAFKDYDPMSDLLISGFFPNNTVTYNAMLFHQALANNPILVCFTNPAANNYILTEIWSCYDNTADTRRINCPGSLQNQLLTCGGPNGFILFPTI
ncbi:Ribonuclease-like storage protein [Linum perenne]